MFTRYLIARITKTFGFNTMQRLANKDHILSCDICSNIQHYLKSFTIIRKCQLEFYTKIHKALLIKKLAPKLNRQVYAKGASFLLQAF